MPQIEQIADTYASQIFWTLLAFGFVFFVVGLGMLPRVLSTVDQRDPDARHLHLADRMFKELAQQRDPLWREAVGLLARKGLALIADRTQALAEQPDRRQSPGRGRIGARRVA